MDDKGLLEIVAYHEAGHAVMTLNHGQKLQDIAITSPWAGYVRGGPSVERAQQACYKASPYRRLCCLSDVLVYIKILLAGSAAEYEFRGLPLHVPGSAWYLDHSDVLETLAVPRIRKAFEQYVPGGLHALANEVVEWVIQPKIWDTIRVVAEAVLTNHYMQWEELQEWLLVNQLHKSQRRLF